MLISKNRQSFDWQNKKGENFPDVCSFFEGVEVSGYLNADNKINNFHLKIYVNDNGIENFISIPVGELSNPTKLVAALANEGLIIHNSQAKDAYDLLVMQERKLMRNPTIMHKQLGVVTLNSKTVFLQEKNVLDSKIYEYSGKIKLQMGNRQTYDNCLRSIVFKSRNLTLAYMIGMSAPVVSVLANANIVPFKMININFAGKSSTGKSTMAELALSPFGNPDLSESGLGFAESTTSNAIYESFDGINGLPRALDDINQNDRLNMEELIYAIFSGKPKRRMDNHNTGNRCGWSGTNIITSETPIILEIKQKSGVYARVLTLEMEQWTASKDEAERVHSIVSQNFGGAGQEFVARLLSDIRYLQNRYKIIRNEIAGMIKVSDTLTARISAQITAVALTVDCYLRYYPNAFEWSYLDLIKPFIEGEKEMVSERDIAKRILNILQEYISTNKLHFNCERYGIDGIIIDYPLFAYAPFGVIKYYLDIKDFSVKYRKVYVYKEHFDALMNMKNIFDYKSGLARLRQNGVLICDSDKRLQTKINGVRCYCFLIKEDEGGNWE